MISDYSFLEKWEIKSPYKEKGMNLYYYNTLENTTRCSKGMNLYNYYFDTKTSEDTIQTVSEYITPWIKYISNQIIITNDYVSNNEYVWVPPSKEEKLRAQIQANLRPHLLRATRTDSDHTALMGQNNDIAEQRARLLLRDMIGEEAFRQYLKRGFITCQGPSGIRYRVTGGHNKIMAYVKNAEGRYVPFEELCIVVTEPMPFTDWVIWRKLMCEGDEFALRKIANVTKLAQLNPAIYVETPTRAIA